MSHLRIFKASICSLGQLIDHSVICPDPEKVKGIQAMKEPKNITELVNF